MKFTKLKKMLAIVILFLCANSLFAVEEYVSKLYKDIDVIFIEKSDEKLNNILQENREDRYYYLIENYAEKKIRRLIVTNDYEFAMNAIVVVIENNLDNEEAVEMYAIIADAYQVQLDYEAKQEELRQVELARIEGEKEKQRDNVDKEYVSSKTAEGSAVYVTGKETKLTNYNWDISFGLLDLALTNDASNKYFSMNDGLAGNVNFVYLLGKNAVGVDAFAEFDFLPLGDPSKVLTMLTDIEFAPKYGITKNLFVRAGILCANVSFTDTNTYASGIIKDFKTPLIGIELNKLELGNLKLSMNVDYLLGHLYTPGLDFAMQGGFNIAIPYANLERVRLNFNIGVKDKIFVKTSGIENRASVIIAVGAENVIN